MAAGDGKRRDLYLLNSADSGQGLVEKKNGPSCLNEKPELQ
jgi:hypothetical protein